MSMRFLRLTSNYIGYDPLESVKWLLRKMAFMVAARSTRRSQQPWLITVERRGTVGPTPTVPAQGVGKWGLILKEEYPSEAEARTRQAEIINEWSTLARRQDYVNRPFLDQL